MKVVRYVTKLPFEGYDKIRGGAGDVGAGDSMGPDSSSGSVTQFHTDLKPIHHYRLFRFMRKYSLFAAWLAGGGGSDLLRETRKASVRAAQNLQEGNPPMNPGGGRWGHHLRIARRWDSFSLMPPWAFSAAATEDAR